MSGPGLEFGPVLLGSDRLTSPVGRGVINRSGYKVFITGEVEIGRALNTARLLGVPALAASAEGRAQVELQIAGSWTGAAAGEGPPGSRPLVTGTAQLRGVRAELRGIEEPLEISTAELQLLPEEVHVIRLTAHAAHTSWTGSLQLPRGCGTPGACVLRFNLNTNEISLGALSQWASTHQKSQPWYRALASTARPRGSLLTDLHAVGVLAANRVLIRDLAATHVSANINLENGKLQISSLRADLLGGQHRGDWIADFRVKPVTYSGSGAFSGISLGRVADAMNDKWIAGTVTGNYKVTATGSSATEFWQSADGTVQFDMREGVLPHISLLSDAGALQVERFQGEAQLREGRFEIKDARLDSTLGTFGVNGTVSLQRELDLKLTQGPVVSMGNHSHKYAISGTVAEPQVVLISTPETQARLKP